MAVAKFESIATVRVASGTTAPVPKPAGLQVGDLLLAVGMFNTGSIVVIGLPSGFVLFDQHSNTGVNEPEQFFASKFADSGDVAASTFNFTSTITTTLMVGLLRISGAVTVTHDFEPGETGDGAQANPSLLELFATGVDTLIVRFAGINTTGNEPSSISDPPGHTRRAIEGGALVGGSSDPVAVWWTKDAIVPQGAPLPIELVTLTGNTGNTRAVTYTLSFESGIGGGSGGIMEGPTAQQPVTKADVLAARAHAKAIGAKVKTKFDPFTRR